MAEACWYVVHTYSGYENKVKANIEKTIENRHLEDQILEVRESEVEVVRVRITLACTECKQRNYNMTKDKKTHPDRMETKKYCRFCKRHTLHKETK